MLHCHRKKIRIQDIIRAGLFFPPSLPPSLCFFLVISFLNIARIVAVPLKRGDVLFHPTSFCNSQFIKLIPGLSFASQMNKSRLVVPDITVHDYVRDPRPEEASNSPLDTHPASDGNTIRTLGSCLGLRSGIAKLCKFISRITSKILVAISLNKL